MKITLFREWVVKPGKPAWWPHMPRAKGSSKMSDKKFEEGIESYLQYIKQDYTKWMNLTEAEDAIQDSIRRTMAFEFCNGIKVTRGKKYLKVVAGRSTHSFIVLTTDNGFKVGDILKAASYASPARNFSRGNILNRDWSNVTWTGA